MKCLFRGIIATLIMFGLRMKTMGLVRLLNNGLRKIASNSIERTIDYE